MQAAVVVIRITAAFLRKWGSIKFRTYVLMAIRNKLFLTNK